MPLRILPHKVIKEECHPRVQREFLMVMMPNFYEHVLLPLFSQYDAWLKFADKKVKLWVEYIKYKAKTAGYEVSAYGRPCHREETTCLGKYSTHFPYFKITKPVRKYIEKARERDFLREIGLTEEEIEEAESWFGTLAVIHQLRNGTAKGLDWLGVIEADFGEKEEVVEEHGVRE